MPALPALRAAASVALAIPTFDPKAAPPLAWWDGVRSKFTSGSASSFVLYGDTDDLQPFQRADGTREWVPGARTFLERSLARTKSVATFDIDEGLHILARQGATPGVVQKPVIETDAEAERNAAREAAMELTRLNVLRIKQHKAQFEELPQSPRIFVTAAKTLLTDISNDGTALIVDGLEMVAPNAEPNMMTDDAKAATFGLAHLSSDPVFLHSANVMIALTKSLGSVSSTVRTAANQEVMQIPYPDKNMRHAFLHDEVSGFGRDGSGALSMDMSVERLADMTAGLTLVDLRMMLKTARHEGTTITYEFVNARKKQIIEQQCGNLVEFVNAEHNFESVGGMDDIKAQLLSVVRDIKDGRRDRVPMGILFSGAMGTGKTFIAEALAKETGMTCLKLGTIRGKYVGETEANLDKVLDLIDALGNVILMIDEADRTLASGGSDGDGGTNSRIIARLKEYMSDSKHKGRVMFIMMSNRPDLMDVDLKRPKRMDLKIPFFYPETADERYDHLVTNLNRNHLTLAEGVSLESVVEKSEGYSPAELARIVESASEILSRGLKLPKEIREQFNAACMPSDKEAAITALGKSVISFLDKSEIKILSGKIKEIRQKQSGSREDRLAAKAAKLQLAEDLRQSYNAKFGSASESNIITQSVLDQAFFDFVPSRDKRRLRLMELLAAFESSSHDMLPERYRNMSSEELQMAIDVAKAEIGTTR